jgi:gliding motility-associated-like protein
MDSDGGNGLVQICYTSAPCSTTTATILETACSNYTAPWGVTYNQTGNYSDTIVNSIGCDSIIQLNLTITGLPALTISAGSGTCGQANGTATASATGGAGNYAYIWSNASTGSFITGLSPGSYSVIATDQNGCSATSQVIVNTTPASGVTLTASDTLLGLNESATLEILGGETYNWSPALGLNCTDCPTVIATPQSSTTYTVTGTDSIGCPYIRVVNVLIDIICNELFVPDIFSPNGVGNPENDKLCVYSNCIKSMNLGIYNRWGELIFTTDNQNDCWDGTHKGEPVMTGVYSYRLFVEQFDGEKIEKSGVITLTK